MSNQKVFLKLKVILAEILKIEMDTIKLESSLVGDLGIDSVDFMDLIIVIADEFKIKIETDKLPELKKISDIVLFVTKSISDD